MSRASPEEQAILDQILPENRFDVEDSEVVARFLKAFNIQITLDESTLLPGWSVLWAHGGGLVCPPMPEPKARAVIALSCYLDLCGVDVGLTNRLAYWYVRGRALSEIANK